MTSAIITFYIGAVRTDRREFIDAVWLAVAHLPVIAQSVDADVLFLTTAALVRPLVVVHTDVHLEVVRAVEPLLTHVASKRLLSRVEP